MIRHAYRRPPLYTASFALVAASMALLPATLTAQTTQTRQISGHLPPILATSQVVGRTNPNENVPLALVLPLRNQAQLDDLLNRLYDPLNTAYGQYLTPEQFTANFGPTQADYQAVIDYAKAHGLTVTGTHSNRLIVNVSGSAQAVEKAVGVQLFSYQDRTGRIFRAPAAEPVVPTELAQRLSGIVGLDTAARWHPHSILRKTPSGVEAPRYGTGPLGGLVPNDIKAAYGLNTISANGLGQTLGAYELDGYNVSDITYYENAFGLPHVPLQNVLVDGYSGGAGGGAGEVTLDLQMQIALAPNASKILVYEGLNTSTGVLDLFNRIAMDNQAKEICAAWGSAESTNTTSFLNSENTIFQQMTSQGQSIFAAAGDAGAYDDGSTLSVDDPGSQPYMVSCGGTSLNTASPGGIWQSETSWNNGSAAIGAGGGGISNVWPIPSYQSGVISVASKGSTTNRNVPDISLNGDPNVGYATYFQGQWQVAGGTSATAPLWSAFAAMVNQYRARIGSTPIGFMNPALYTLGKSANGALDFHDIADGSNNLFYPAVKGFDDSTGWGTIDATYLFPALVSPNIAVLHRLYDPAGANHFLTPNPPEANALISAGWQVEGDVGIVYLSAGNASSGLTAFYRLFNPYNGDHFYTLHTGERDAAIAAGYKLEGTAGYVFSTAAAGRQPLYRVYNRANGLHVFTVGLAEYQALSSYPWVQEGIVAYTQ